MRATAAEVERKSGAVLSLFSLYLSFSSVCVWMCMFALLSSATHTRSSYLQCRLHSTLAFHCLFFCHCQDFIAKLHAQILTFLRRMQRRKREREKILHVRKRKKSNVAMVLVVLQPLQHSAHHFAPSNLNHLQFGTCTMHLPSCKFLLFSPRFRNLIASLHSKLLPPVLLQWLKNSISSNNFSTQLCSVLKCLSVE